MGKGGKEQLAFEATYNQIRQQLKNGVSGEAGSNKEHIFWAVVEGATIVLDEVDIPGVGLLVGTGKLIYDTIKGRKHEPAAIPNPWFVWNGHDDNPTRYTRKYMKTRDYKGLASSAINTAGAIASSQTYVDIGSLLTNANALGSTGVHIHRFHAIAKSYKESRTIASWLSVILKMKAMKAGIKTAGLIGAAIPVPALGAVTGALAAAGALKAKMTMTKACLATSADLHWRAYQELALTSRFGGTGPGLRIVRELFTRRGVTRIFGKYEVDEIIREPNGWLAINDKLMLM